MLKWHVSVDGGSLSDTLQISDVRNLSGDLTPVHADTECQ